MVWKKALFFIFIMILSVPCIFVARFTRIIYQMSHIYVTNICAQYTLLKTSNAPFIIMAVSSMKILRICQTYS